MGPKSNTGDLVLSLCTESLHCELWTARYIASVYNKTAMSWIALFALTCKIVSGEMAPGKLSYTNTSFGCSENAFVAQTQCTLVTFSTCTNFRLAGVKRGRDRPRTHWPSPGACSPSNSGNLRFSMSCTCKHANHYDFGVTFHSPGRTQEVCKIFITPINMAHRAVIFDVAQLSCNILSQTHCF